MSRLLPDIRCLGSTRVLVTADRLLAEHRPAGWHAARQTAQLHWTGTPLQAALPALLSQLPASRWRCIDVYVADHHVYLLRLPAMMQSMQAMDIHGQELQAYARAVLMQTYGDVARSWPFRLADIQPQQDRLLAAIPALQTLDLNVLLAPHAIQWTVQPYASALWARTRLPARGTLLTAEPNMLRLLQLDQWQMTHVASLATNGGDEKVMAAWVLRERTLLGVQATPCYWIVEPACHAMAQAGQRLKQVLSGQVAWHVLPAASAITPLIQESAHVA